MSLRRTDGESDEDLVRSDTGVDVFEPSMPWRTFRRRYGQKHYSGTYGSSTMRDHVVYFDRDVTAVFAQPFLLSTTVDGRRREVVQSRGWDFQVWTEPLEAELENLRFLAGYRRQWLFDEDLLAEIRAADLYGATPGDAFRAFPQHEADPPSGPSTASSRNLRRTPPTTPVPGSRPVPQPRGGQGHAMRLTGLGKRVVAAAQPYSNQLGDLHGPRHRPKPPQHPTDDLAQGV
ncbi:hypothetical protein [Streptomyces niveiscabiei]|uniref:Uncharacterized protein n=1 Tax=Streptomyces niveiscabiei TaxID=164115 RepID=A0ABW9HM22_9ACTN